MSDRVCRDLLAQARTLVTAGAGRPKQVSLRRGVSSAYYALFHLLVRKASRRILGHLGTPALRAKLARAFDHAAMAKISKAFASGGALPAIGNLPGGVPADLSLLARTFVDLQERRHRADYDYEEKFTRQEATKIVDDAEAGVAAWERVSGAREARLYLVLLLAGVAIKERK